MEVVFAINCWRNLVKMQIRDQSIPYINLYILSPLTLFCRSIWTKIWKKSRQNALCIRDQICDKYILNKHAERCSYVFGHMEISLYFTLFFYESISLKKEHLKLMHLFLANQGQKSFFLWSVKCLYIFYSPFIKRKRSSKFPIGSARHFFNVFAQWCLEIIYRPVAKNLFEW